MTLPRPRTTRRSRRRAFTLVEVLATMVLMGIVIPAAMHGIALATATAEYARDKAEAATLGETKLAELVTLGDWSLAGTSGDFGQDWPKYRWTLQNTARDYNVNELVLTVVWTARGQEQALPVSTLVYSSATTPVGVAR